MDKLKRFDKVVFFDGDKLQVPTRDDFMPDREIRTVEAQVTAGKPILFNANTAKEYMMDFKQGTQILLIGHTYCGRKASLLLNNIDIYIDIFPAEVAFDRESKLSNLLYSEEFISMSNIDKLKESMKYEAFKAFHDKLMLFISANKCKSHALIYKYIYELGIHEKVLGYRLYFKTIKDQRDAVNKYDSGKITGAFTYPEFFVTSYSSRSTNFVDTVAARYDIYIGSWMKIQKYNSGGTRPITKCHYNFVADIRNYLQITDVDLAEMNMTVESLNTYRSLYCFFDIETANLRKQEDLRAESNNKNILSAGNVIFNIGCVFSLETDDAAQSFCVNIINTGANPAVMKREYRTFQINGSYTIVTTSPRNTILAFIRLLEGTKPDFIPGFNSLDFDIPQLLFSMRIENLFDIFYSTVSVMNSDNLYSYKYVYKHNGSDYRHNSAGYTFWANARTTSQVSGISGLHKHEDVKLKVNNGSLPEIKIKPKENKSYHDIAIPGLSLLDVMLISWKKDVKKSAKGGGLNFYLKEFGFPEKLDVPYYQIWIFYQYSTTHDVCTKPTIRLGTCVHGLDNAHDYIERDGNTYRCKGYKRYMLGQQEIERNIYRILGGKSLNENLREVAVYCSYDSMGSLLLLKKYKFMEEKRKYCVYVNMTPHKVIYLADMNKAENGLRKIITESDYVYIEEKQVASREENTPAVKRLLAANPRLERYHMNHKAPRNKGGHVEIKVKGKITQDFWFDLDGLDVDKIKKRLEDDKIYYEIHGNKLMVRIPMPVEGIDFASLYPSIIMAFNLCKSKITFDLKDIDRARIIEPNVMYMTVPVKSILDDSDFPEQLCEYYEATHGVKDFASANIYIIQHGGDKDKYGVLPKFMGDFFDKRKLCKNLQFRATDLAEGYIEMSMDRQEMLDLFKTSGSSDFKSFLESYLFGTDEVYKNWKIEIINQEGRQLAIKITMNSTYGTLDTIHSAFYSSIVATLVTFFGRKYVKLSGSYCEENDCVVVYHDTDSTYFHHNKSVFQNIVSQYLHGEINKNNMYRKIVMRSIKLTHTSDDLRRYYSDKIKDLKENVTNPEKVQALELKLSGVPAKTFVDKLNDLFAERSGSRFLRQIREETLFPVVYSMLKKYFGVVHGTKFTENYSIKNVLLRGLKIRTGNCTGFLADFSARIIKRILEENNTREIVFDELNKLLHSQPDYDKISLYENSARYKQGTKNAVQGMVRRMNEKRDRIVDPKLRDLHRAPFELESILYINTKPKHHYDIMGRKYSPNKQELAEYSRVVSYLYKKHLATGSDYYEINMRDYVISAVSTCAQLLSSDTDFEGYYPGITHKDYVKIVAKHLKQYCINYYNALPENIEVERKRVEYSSYIRKNKGLFKEILAAMCSVQNDDATNMMLRMINIKVPNFSTKLENIAKTGYLNISSISELYYSEEGYTQDDIAVFRQDCLIAEQNMRGQYQWLDIFRESLVDAVFAYAQKVCFGMMAIEDIKPEISEEDIYRLSYCELAFSQYCGYYAFLTGTTKYFYVKVTIEFPDI